MTRMNAHHRKRMIRVNAAILANEIGLAELTFENVASKCPVETSPSTVRHYFKYLSDLQVEACGDDPTLMTQAREMGLIE